MNTSNHTNAKIKKDNMEPNKTQGQEKSIPNVEVKGQTKLIPTKKKPAKRWTWSKPKDKPKRPLSAYNIFFKHTRSRIVEGLSEEETEEEIITSVEAILSNSAKKKKRERKSHGKISFRNLASVVSEKWKNTDNNRMALFQHYALKDKKRYFSELESWKAKKKNEDLKTLPGSSTNGNDSKRSSSMPLEVSETSSSTQIFDSESSSCEDNSQLDSGFRTRAVSDEWKDRFQFEPPDLSEADKSTINSQPPMIIDSFLNPTQTKTTIRNLREVGIQNQEQNEVNDSLYFALSATDASQWNSDPNISSRPMKSYGAVLNFPRPLNVFDVPIDETVVRESLADTDHDMDPAPLDEIQDSQKWYL
eukprot:CAMPEP_0197183466 /NCGR_PEP_ID=MMETSP1423-20130617/7835_1 /TAXON_ID=476441 /ORGANISM="Pseudo-nitzschia heimii, Strain UNC1101" /LENGTH=360 /DNA_ID=CAMNT_0042634049 /DNA_START=83 /DNA_END=1165 /DNA_ORIENTATION=-